MTTYYIGTSGWHYPHWRGVFYPETLRPADWLDFYTRHLATVELNASFYRLPALSTVRAWCDHVPPDFVFAIKASRFITHRKKLRAPRHSLAALLKVVRAFGVHAGPVLFQLPPRWRCNLERLAAFLRALPVGLPTAFEFRDPSWHQPGVYALLRRYRAAFCIHELAGFESSHVRTADYAYVRLHGPSVRAYSGCYTEAALRAWAAEIRTWRRLKRVYVYFDNDQSGHAVRNALMLRALLSAPAA